MAIIPGQEGVTGKMRMLTANLSCDVFVPSFRLSGETAGQGYDL